MVSIESQLLDVTSRKTDSKEEKKTTRLFKTMCQKFWRPIIILLSLMILTLTFLTYFGLYTILNNLTKPVQSVTVSSEGLAGEMHPECMGQYNILRDVYRYDRAVYKHVDREDRFIVYLGKNTGFLEQGCSPSTVLKKKQPNTCKPLATIIAYYEQGRGRESSLLIFLGVV